MKPFYLSVALGALLVEPFLPAPVVWAQDYDMDCKVILCLAGGFPANCGDARAYMLNRLRDGKSPFGVCSYEDGEDYEAVTADVRFLQGKQSYLCEQGQQLFYQHGSESSGLEVFCYTSSRTRRQGDGDVTIYEGKSSPTHVNFTTKIIVEPGTVDAFASPRYFVNTETGVVVER